MQTEKSRIRGRKILAITLLQLAEIVKTHHAQKPTYKNTYFDYFMFVGRLIKNEDKYIFTDQTQILQYELKKFGSLPKLTLGAYYECVCSLKSMNTSFKPEILNANQVEGNFITTHMARVMKEEIQLRMEQKNKQSNDQANITMQQLEKPEQTYNRLKQWMIEKQQFTQQELKFQYERVNNGRYFSDFLTKLEDDAVIGNMGSYYQYIG